MKQKRLSQLEITTAIKIGIYTFHALSFIIIVANELNQS